MRRLFGPALAAALLAGCQALERPAEPEPAPETPVAVKKGPQAPADAAATRPFPPDAFHDLLVAEVALRRGAYQLALDNYMQQAVATRDPEVAARAARLAQFLRADSAALAAGTLWVELEPDNLEANFTMASQLAKQAQPLAALPFMERVLEGDAKTNFAMIAAASAERPPEERDALMQRFDALLEANPNHAELLTGKALLLQQAGEREGSLKLVRQVLAETPDDTHALLIETRLLEEMGREAEAFDRLAAVVEQNPYNRRLRLQYARLLTETDMEAARQQFEILVQQSPFDPDLLLSLALISRETGAHTEAERYFEQLLEMGQRVGESHYYLGLMAEQREAPREALDHYLQIPPGGEFLPGVTRGLGLLLRDDDLEGVRHFLQQLREQHPQQATRLYLIESEVLMERGQHQAGHELLSRALEDHPLQPNLLYARSLFSEKLGDLPALERDLEAILAVEPDDVHALNALGYSLANHSNRLEEAYRLIQRAHAQKPEDPAILDSLGWVEFKRGNTARARELLERAYAGYPDPEVALHLGVVLHALGEDREARAVWLEALEKEPDNALLRDALSGANEAE